MGIWRIDSLFPECKYFLMGVSGSAVARGPPVRRERAVFRLSSVAAAGLSATA